MQPNTQYLLRPFIWMNSECKRLICTRDKRTFSSSFGYISSYSSIKSNILFASIHICQLKNDFSIRVHRMHKSHVFSCSFRFGFRVRITQKKKNAELKKTMVAGKKESQQNRLCFVANFFFWHTNYLLSHCGTLLHDYFCSNLDAIHNAMLSSQKIWKCIFICNQTSFLYIFMTSELFGGGPCHLRVCFKH